MFEEIVKESIGSDPDPLLNRFYRALDAVNGGNPPEPLRRVLNALWGQFTAEQRATGQGYLVVMGYLGTATALLTEFGGDVVEW